MPTMSKKLKFRSRAKDPAAKTATDGSNGSPDSTKSSPPASTPTSKAAAMSTKGQSEKPSKRSGFRGLAIGPHKRRRSPPVELPSSPSAAVVTHSVGIDRHHDNTAETRQEGRKKKAKMPSFLESSDVDTKFREITWMERNRVAFGVNSPERNKHMPEKFQHAEIRHPGMAGMDRYVNIKPWGHNRIRLNVMPAELDYVNASPIVLTSPSNPNLPPLRYIAMQGPTRQSLDFVWRMVAEQLTSPVVIVQLTNMYESNDEKCFPYFPCGQVVSPQPGTPLDTEQPYEDTQWTLNHPENAWKDGWKADLRHAETRILADGAIEQRKILFKVDGEEGERVVWHFLYTKWPDFGVPALEDLGSFFELMRLSQKYNTAGIPRIIHCSAGVGRTGTFITLEHLMRELDAGYLENYDSNGEEKPDLIFNTVNALREQRKAMVQGLPQFMFIYRVMRKLWLDKYDDVGQSNEEPSAKRLEVAEPFSD